MNSIKFASRYGAIVFAMILAMSAGAQTAATLMDLGAAAPIPGPLDIAQLSTDGDTTSPDGLNYYTDNNSDLQDGEPGQTFTTPASTNGFILTSLGFKSAGLDAGGGAPGAPINYLLHIYSISDGNSSLLASYVTASPVSYGEGDWLQWTGLSLPLLPGTAYAYSIGNADGNSGWDAIGVAGGNPYPGGEIALIFPGGGPMIFGGSDSYDATFDIGLISAPPTPPSLTNLPATGVQAVAATLNGQIVGIGGSLLDVTLCYGTSDGGTNLAAWQYAVDIGGQSGSFDLTVPGLAPNTTYFYTAFASDSSGSAWAIPSQSFTTLMSNPVPTPIAVLTYHNDNARDGANTNETALTLANVNTASFGLLFSYPVDGYVYAQPLIVTNVNIPGQGVHDVVYIATENDSVYAFDANGNLGTNAGLLWSTNLGLAGQSASGDFGTRYSSDGEYHDLIPEVGITGTPVIDPDSGTIYFDTFNFNGTSNGVDIYNHRIHALDITTGCERPYSPVVVEPSVPGTGVDSLNGVVSFNAVQQLQRPGLTLVGGIVYVAYGSYGDTDPYHGWVLGFNATNLQLLPGNIFNTTPNASVADFGPNAGEGSIWQGGSGLCVDANTNLYFETANGSFSANTNGADYGDSFMRLSTSNGMAVADYFTPYDQATLEAIDLDLGPGGPILLPDSVGSATHPHLIVGNGKEGTIYLVDRDNMGQYNPTDNSQIVQCLTDATGDDTGGTPAYFNGLIYYQPEDDVMSAFSISNAMMSTSPVSASSYLYSPGAPPSISANGNDDGIVWTIDINGDSPAILRAYNATNLSEELYDSSQLPLRDNPAGGVKFTAPTVAGGKVYVGCQYGLAVYGNGVFLSSPVIAPQGGTFTNSVAVTFLGAPSGVSLYYTLDGSLPTTNSIVYTGPFTLTNSATVQAIAAAPGAVNSVAAGAAFNVVPSGLVQTLASANYLEGPAAGSDSVLLTANSAWTATANSSWLHLDAANQSGTTNANIVFSFDMDSGATRMGTLTIAGQTVIVLQAGSNYVAAGPVMITTGLNLPNGVAVDGEGNVYIADTYNNVVKEWIPASDTTFELVSSNLSQPNGVAVDVTGNVYISDTWDHAIKEWIAASDTVTTLVTGLFYPTGIALDGADNVYIGDLGDNVIYEWTAASNTIGDLVSSGLNYPNGVALDSAGDVYIADSLNNVVKEWTGASNPVTTLVPSGLNYPSGVAVDVNDNVYIADAGDNAIKEWRIADGSLTTLDSSTLTEGYPIGIAVDAPGDVFFADQGDGAVEELVRAFVNTTVVTEPPLAGADVLPAVVPASANLSGPFAPSSDSPWLSITGITNGVVSFAFVANTSSTNRTANIAILGQTNSIIQAAVTPPILTGFTTLSSGAFQFGFTNNQGVPFTVCTSTNLLLPLADWTVLGEVTNDGFGLYQFTDSTDTNDTQRFYQVTFP
jgi:sugar lactone lactonase YvrE